VDAILAQYGAIGLLASLALLAVRTLFVRETDAHDKETKRADRAEEELAKLNELVRNQYISILAQATSAIGDAVAVVRGLRVPSQEDSPMRKGKRRRR